MKISREELEQMTKEYLKDNEIKVISSSKKKSSKPQGIINVYLYGETIEVM